MKKVKDFLRLTVTILLLALPLVAIFSVFAEILGDWKSLTVTTSIVVFSFAFFLVFNE